MEQPKDYTIKSFKVGDFKDQNGNAWCEVLFDQFASEPVRWVVKEPTKYAVGQSVYGHIETKTSQAGKPYLRFYRDQKADFHGGGTASVGAVASKKEWQPRDDDAIRAQWAIGQAVSTYKSANDSVLIDYAVVQEVATRLYAMVDKVKASNQLDTTPDPMQQVHANNPMNPAVTNEFGDGSEYLGAEDLPPDYN